MVDHRCLGVDPGPRRSRGVGPPGRKREYYCPIHIVAPAPIVPPHPILPPAESHPPLLNLLFVAQALLGLEAEEEEEEEEEEAEAEVEGEVEKEVPPYNFRYKRRYF